MSINESDWIAALEEAQAGKDAKGMTSEELSSLWGVSRRTAGERIRFMARRGLITLSGYRHGISVDLKGTKTPVYSVKKKVQT